MKKRLLSLLLLVAMIVTALPLMALPAIAAETGEKEYTAEDYNALYVQDDLVFAMDFFRTNSNWDGTTTSYTNGDDLKAAMLAAMWKGATDFTLSISWADGNSATAANGFLDATVTQVTASGLHKLTQSGYASGGGATMNGIFQLPAATQQLLFHNLRINISGGSTLYRMGVQVDSSYGNSLGGVIPQFLTEDGKKIGTTFSAAPTSFAFAMSVTDPTLGMTWDSKNLTAIHEATYITVEGEDEPVLSVSSATRDVITWYVPVLRQNVTTSYVDGEKVDTPQTFSNVYVEADNRTTGFFGFYENAKPLYENGEVPYLNNNKYDTDIWYLGTYQPDIYALRYYGHTLTTDELAQNHLVDLLKWFRADLSYVKLLNEASLVELATLAVDYTISDEGVAAALKQKAKALAEAQYSSLDADVLALAAAYDLDLSPLETYPKGVLPATYTFLLSGIASSENVTADYEAAVNADLLAYFAMGTMTLEDYNTLYVQNGYLFGIDFFAANKIWSPNGVAADLGADFVQPTDLTKDDLAVYTVTKTLGETVTNVVTLETEAEANAKLAELTAAETEGATYAIVTAPASNHATVRNTFITKINDFLAKWVTKQPAVGAIRLQNSMVPLRGTAPAYTNLDQYLKNQIAVGVLEDGYLQLRSGRPTDNYLNLSGLPNVNQIAASSLVSDAMTQQIVGVHDAKASNGNPILMFGNARINVRYDQVANGMTFYSVGTNFTPSETVRPSVILSSEATTLTFELRNFKSNALTNGAGALGIKNGTTSLVTLNGFYAGAGANAHTFGIGYGNSTAMKLYATRYYNVSLTADELAQNHFADLAKFFRLNLSGFETLGDAEKKALYAAVSTFDLTSDRVAVQDAVSAVLTPCARKTYEAMKGEDAKINAFLDVAADYLLDVSAVLAAKRDVSSVYETVTADALAGKTAAEAQAILDEAYFDAYYYLSYAIPGEDAFNAFLAALAEGEAHLNVEHLMALPKAERLTGAALALEQDAIDAYVAEKMADYKTADYDYDSLYVQDGLLSQTDFFKLNSYWGESYTLPTAPSASVTNSDLTAGEILQTDGEWIVVRWNYGAKDAYHHGIKADGAWSFTTDAKLVPTTLTEAEAKAEVEALLAAEPGALYEAIPYAGDNGQWVTAAYKSLTTTYANDVNAQLASFTLKGDRAFTLALPAITYKTYHDQSGAHQRAPFAYADGYLQMDHHHANSFLLLKPAMPTSGTVTGEYIITSGAERAYSSNYMHTSDVTVKTGKVTATSTVFNGFYTYNGTFTETSSGRDFATPYTAVIGNNTPYSLATVVDRGDGSGSVSASLYFNGTQIGATETTTDTTPANIATQIAYSSPGTNNRIYAIRYYDRALTAADYAQNHFADLMKFFRIDMAAYDLLSDAEQAAVRAALAPFALDADRAEVVAAYEAVLSDYYAAAADALDAYFLTLAEEAQLDLAPLLAIRERAARDAIAACLTEEFPEDYATDKEVLRSLYADAFAFLDSIEFLGVQVRLATGVDDMPGVRSIFRIGEAELAALLASGKTVTLGATVEANVGGVAKTFPIIFEPTLNGDGSISFSEDSGLTRRMTDPDTGEEFLSFAYTVTYKNYGTYTDEVAKTNYNTEFDYSFYVEVDGVRYTRDVDYPQFEGGTVSAYKAYKYFNDRGLYTDDPLMTEVLGRGTPAE